MSTHAANPSAAFFATPPARAIAALLRQLDRLAPQVGTRLALRLFLTPLPTKRRARRRPVPAGWRVEALPFEGSHVAVWRREGAIESRPKVLLVHGWGGDAQQMLVLAELLAGEGFEPLLVDLPAHGHAGGWRSNLVQWTRALFALASRHGPWQAVIGHSLGALALAHALARGLPARQAVLIATAPPPRQFLAWFASALGLGEGMAERMARRIEHREGVAMQGFEPAWLGERLQQPTAPRRWPAPRPAAARPRRPHRAAGRHRGAGARAAAGPARRHRGPGAPPRAQRRVPRAVGGAAGAAEVLEHLGRS